MTGKKTRKRRSAKRRTLTEEEYFQFKAMKEQQSLPERFRDRHPLLVSQSDLKRPPGNQPSDLTKLKISHCVSVDPVFAKRIDDVLKKTRGNLSVRKDPTISDLRNEIIDTVPSIGKKDKTKVREWLRDRQALLMRRKKR